MVPDSAFHDSFAKLSYVVMFLTKMYTVRKETVISWMLSASVTKLESNVMHASSRVCPLFVIFNPFEFSIDNVTNLKPWSLTKPKFHMIWALFLV